MNEVFVSYKREDEVRVVRLVRALERAGFSVWWDRGLPGGESWRVQIQSALDAATCVIVAWTRKSVGPDGDFVRDEAGQAKRRGILVPVLLEKVEPPLGFGEIQAVDLTRWRERQRDPFFEDLCAAVRAKLEGRQVPPATGPTRRLLRRLTYGTLTSAAGAAAVVIGVNAFGVQERLCAANVFQPRISDTCGALGVGARPTRDERLAWEARSLGSCVALRSHIERFPHGVHRARAAELLAARSVTQTETWHPSTRRLVMVAMQDGKAVPSEEAARAAALTRGQVAAERLCKGFAATTLYRFTSARPVAQTWDCGRVGTGMVCGFEGEAECLLEERRSQESERCGE